MSIVALVITCSIPTVYAKERGVSISKINTYDKFMEITKDLNLNNSDDIVKLEKINNLTTENVKEQYRERMVNEVNEILSMGVEIPDDKNYVKKSFDLENGGELVIECKSTMEKGVGIETKGSDSTHHDDGSSYKSYGTHTYTVTSYVRSLVDGALYLENKLTYKVASNGLTATNFSSRAFENSILMTSAKVEYSKITDSRAEKVGYDINGEAKTSTETLDGDYLPTGRKYTLRNDVRAKLESLSSSKAKVKEHMYAYMTY